MRAALRVVLLAGAASLPAACSATDDEWEPLVDLGREAETAELITDTARIDFGDDTARDALLTGWSVDERWAGEETFVWSVGETSRLRIWRLRRGRLGLRLRCRSIGPLPPSGQRMTVLVNDQPAATVEVGESFGIQEVTVAGQLLRPGDNVLGFRYSYVRPPFATLTGQETRRLAVAWDWLELLPAAAPRPPQSLLRTGASGATLVLPFGQRLDYYLELPAGARLRWEGLTARPAGRQTGRQTGSQAPAELRVEVSWRGTGPSPRRSESIRPASGAAELKLPVAAASLARISVTARGDDSAQDGALLWHAPRVVRPRALRPRPEESAASGPPGVPRGRPRGIIVYLIDTMRADHLGVYGYRRPVSPHIDAFAARASVFDRAYAQSGWTRSAVASLLTGLPPQAHGVLDRWDGLPGDVPLLPELLRQAGYDTFAVSTNTNVSRAFGFARGFGTFVSLPPEPSGDAAPAVEVNRRFFHWLDAGGGRPFFAYLHTSEPHDPYDAEPPFRGRFSSPRTALTKPDAAAIAAVIAADPTLDLAQLRRDFEDRYDEEIAANDAAFGDLLAGLGDRGLAGDCLIVLLADHGEEFLDHGAWGHGHTLYGELLRVPLVVELPAGWRSRARVSATAQQIDLLPTLLDAAGAAPWRGAGSSLLPLLLEGSESDDRAGADRAVSSYLELGGSRVSSVVLGKLHLLLWSSPRPGGARLELFDLSTDAGEQRDLAGADPIGVGFLRSRLAIERRAWPARPRVPVAMDELTAAELRALGYLR